MNLVNIITNYIGLAFDFYPAEQIATLEQPYFDFVSGEDIAQNEISFGKFLPMNLAANLKVGALMTLDANMPKIPTMSDVKGLAKNKIK